MIWKQRRERFANWELWPFKLIYAPLAPLWLWYVLKARAVWWFTPANPTLTFAGFDGETKREMYEQLPQELYPRTVYVKPAQPFADVTSVIKMMRLNLPLCVKPDAGLKGLLFRKIDTIEQLQYYHEHMPVEYVVQELVEAPLEVSVFYYRHPANAKGVVSGFIQKEMMQVVGDGRSSIGELIQQHPKAMHRLEEMQVKHKASLKDVLPHGETFILTYAANLNRGAKFINLEHEIDERLNAVFDPLSHRCQWFYGRYDIKCNSVEELKSGRFIILEFNGAGAEPNHVYNAGYSWRKALTVFAHHWRMLYQISRYNHTYKNIRYWGDKEGRNWMKKATAHGKLLEKYDREIII